jgi:uncharacterized repeat protein (TIGR03803 family)
MRNSSKLSGGHRKHLRFLIIAIAVVLVGGCGGGGASGGFAIGGKVSGLTGSQPFTLQNNGADALTVTANGSFTFAKTAGSYDVTVITQPAGQICSVSKGSGSMINANVNSVAVNCIPNTYSVGGTLKGLTFGHQITLQNNGADTLTLTADGTFSFQTPVPYGGSFNVTVTSQPGEASQLLCFISVGASGTVSGAVTGVVVFCASVEQVLYNFSNQPDGQDPEANLIMDGAGNLYGTTRLGSGNFGTGYGTVFELSPTATGFYKETILYSFTGGSDGQEPVAGVTMDAAGNLFGTTSLGGDGSCSNGCGTVFKLSRGTTGYTKATLHSFTGGGDGLVPSGLILDGAGNLYGTTTLSNAEGVTSNPYAGTVFKVSPNADGSYTESVLYAFSTIDPSNPQNPSSGLIMDGAGNLYGTTANGGSGNFGVAFRLSPSIDGSYSESILFDFGGSGGARSPAGGLLLDNLGNLYGTAESPYFGVVFKLAPAADGSYTESLLHSFDGSSADGGDPAGSLIMDKLGNLYGTTQSGGAGGGGMVFRLSPAAGGDFTEAILYNFRTGIDGGNPKAGLIFDNAGNLYGTTASGGIGVEEGLEFGTVFEIHAY